MLLVSLSLLPLLLYDAIAGSPALALTYSCLTNTNTIAIAVAISVFITHSIASKTIHAIIYAAAAIPITLTYYYHVYSLLLLLVTLLNVALMFANRFSCLCFGRRLDSFGLFIQDPL